MSFRGGLRARLVVMVLLALVPVFGLFVYSAAENQRNAVALGKSGLQAAALLAAAHQQRLVDRVAQLLNDIANSPQIQSPGNPACTRYLRSFLLQDRAYGDLVLADLNGQVLCRALGTPPTDVSQRQILRQVLQDGRFSIGNYEANGLHGGPSIDMGMPLFGRTGQAQGVLYATLELAAISTALTPADLMASAQSRVTDRQGVVLASSPLVPAPVAGAAAGPEGNPGSPGKLDPDRARYAPVGDQRVGVAEAADAMGVRQVFAYATVGGAASGGMKVTLTVPHENITAVSREVLRINLLALLAVAAGGVSLAWWVGGRLLLRPARAILRQAEEVVNGNLSARVPARFEGAGELGQIAAGFNRVAHALQDRHSQLDQVLSHLGKEHAQLELIINSMRDGVVATDVEGNFLLFNAAARKLMPMSSDHDNVASWRSKHVLLHLDGQRPYADAERPMSRALRGESVDGWDVLMRAPDTRDKILRLSTRPMRDTAGEVVGGLAVFSDITERKLTEDFMRSQEQVLELIARGESLHTALQAVVRLVQSRQPVRSCAILRVEDGAFVSVLPSAMPACITSALDGLPVNAHAGPCGLAAMQRERVVVEDFATDAQWPAWHDRAAEAGVRACWCEPVFAGEGEVVAVISVFLDKPGLPQAADAALLASAVRLAGIALERHRSEAARLLSEARFRELADNVEEVFYIREVPSGRISYVSPAYERLWGRSCESLYAHGPSYLDGIHPDDRHIAIEADAVVMQGREADYEYRVVRPDGQVSWVHDHSYAVLNAAGNVQRVVGTAFNITERKLADQALARTTRALQLLSQCNQALIRIDTESHLLEEVCRLAVDVGGYRMAWVGYAQDDIERSITPMAHAGHEAGYVTSFQLSWSDNTPSGMGPAGQALRTGVAAQCEDIARPDSSFATRQEALARGYRSVLTLPLRDAQRAFGVMCLYAGELQVASAEEIRLLQELADNLAFGIAGIRSRQGRSRIEAAVFKVAAGVSASAGTAFFEQLARNMVEALDGQAGFVTRLLPGQPLKVRCLGGVVNGQAREAVDLALAGTPCEGLIACASVVIPEQLQVRFPGAGAQLFADAQAYVGHRLDDASGRMVGLLFVLFDKPLSQSDVMLSTLRIFASRAGAELERLQADAKVREQASLLDKARDAILVRDLEHRLLYMNRSAEQLYSWPAADALGQSVERIMTNRKAFSRATSELLERGEWAGELEQRALDGTPLVVEGHWTLVRNSEGQPHSVLVINTDIRKRKRAELEIQQLHTSLEERVRRRTAELKLANEELESFCYSVSHDLRTPLSAIDGFSSLLNLSLEAIPEGLAGKSAHYLTRIRAGVVHMGELIDALLSLAQVARTPVHRETVNLSAMANQVFEGLRERQPERQVSFHMEPDLLAQCDPRLLRQVFDNLLGNAWKFSAGRAVARLAFGTLREALPSLSGSGQVVYFVRDNGAGFDMAYADRLFGPFQRLHAISEFEGTGVGLATVHRIIARHGGQIRGEGQAGQGATFYFTLGEAAALA